MRFGRGEGVSGPCGDRGAGPGQRFGVEAMFDRQEAGGETVGRVAGQDGQARLLDDLAIIDAGADPVDTGAGFGVACVEGALVGVEALVFR